MRRHQAYLFAVLLIATQHAAPTSAAWPEFRGPNGDGHVSATGDASPIGLPLTWSETENVRWKTPIPGRGWSTPVIMDGRVWLTTATEDGHDYFVLCVDANTGEVIHNKKLFHCDDPEPLGNYLNCYASPSPAIEPGRVYVHFGTYGTACLDTKTADVIWQRDDLHCRHYRGPSSSVVLFNNLVILTFDGVDVQYVVALDKATGDNVWKTDRQIDWNDQDVTGKGAAEAQRIRDGDHRKAHATPLIFADASGQPQMLSGAAKVAFAYDPRNGQERWRIHFDDFSVAPRPLYRDGVAYLVTGITHPEFWAIRTDGAGDLTETDRILWKLTKGVARTASPLLIDGLIYMVGDEGVGNCTDAATGENVWSKRVGGKFAASPIFGDGRIYFCDQDGQTTVVKPGRKFEILATNNLDTGLMASPAADGRAIYLRTKTDLYRIEDTAK